jgi:hypothetical protein
MEYCFNDKIRNYLPRKIKLEKIVGKATDFLLLDKKMKKYFDENNFYLNENKNGNKIDRLEIKKQFYKTQKTFNLTDNVLNEKKISSEAFRILFSNDQKSLLNLKSNENSVEK